MRVLIEVLHIAVGLLAALLIAALASWSYPLARHDIWLVAYVAMAAVVLMGIGPIRRAYAEDKAQLDRTPSDG
ncbi:hypothetical protein [Sphingomonas sp.]|jgi:membrane protein YdbS with pleckstrin-like domain|uniref:hypothetical protein n=1 Tax=Sphingomonas sp. TaxID=28214 RepID=UPI002ED97425